MLNEQKRYIAYYRVSTQKQGRSGLGLEAQQSDVMRYTNGNVSASYTDIESGKNNKRPELLKAIAHCNEIGATLIIAKLDRLSRDVGFIDRLQKSRVKFICCDMPEANELVIGIMAQLAQYERQMISQRTKSALNALKQRGVKLGGSSKEHCDYMRSLRQPKQYDTDLLQMIRDKRANGKTWKQIADEINTGSHRSMHNKPFSATSVWRIAQKSGYSL